MLDSVTDSRDRGAKAGRARLRRLGARLTYWVIVSLAIAVAAPWTLVNSTERVAVQNLLFDAFQRWRPRVYAEPPPIRIVEIDDESIARLGRWPWPRARLGEMIEKIAGAGAAAVALDILLYDPGDPEDDAKLVKAIQGRPVVLGQFFTNDGNAPRLTDKAGFAFAGDDPTRFAYSFRGAMTPLPAFSKAAAGLGSLNWLPDNDRVVRRVPLVLAVNGTLAPSFAMEALRVAQGASSYTIKSSNGSGEASFGAHTGMVAVQNGDLVAATGPRGDFRIHFAADDPRLRIPAWKLFEPNADFKTFAGAIVFIGVSAQLLYDIVATPLSPATPGVLEHAQTVGQILMNDSLSRPDWAPGGEFLFTVALSALLAVSLPFVSIIGGAAIGAVAALGSAAVSWWAFSRHGLLLDPIVPSLASGAVFVCGVLALFSRKQTEAREIRAAFGRYVSPTVVAKLAADPTVLRLGGEERRVTLMFSDLRGFTTLSEGKTATELTRFLNEYLTPMTDIVLESRGTVDKYIGDAIMAFWNAPLDDPRHAANAVEAALGMRAALAAAQRAMVGGGGGGRAAVPAGAFRRRPQHRTRLRRQSRLAAALRLFGDRRRGQRRLAARKRKQAVRRRHRRQRGDPRGGRGSRVDRGRFRGVQEQDAPGWRLRAGRRRRDRRDPRIRSLGGRPRTHDGALPQPRFRRRPRAGARTRGRGFGAGARPLRISCPPFRGAGGRGPAGELERDAGAGREVARLQLNDNRRSAARTRRSCAAATDGPRGRGR